MTRLQGAGQRRAAGLVKGVGSDLRGGGGGSEGALALGAVEDDVDAGEVGEGEERGEGEEGGDFGEGRGPAHSGWFRFE